LEEGIRIYALDLETRLLIDSIDFDERQEELHSLEREAFLLFKMKIENQLELFLIDEKDFSVSLQHQQFDLYIRVLVNVIQEMERELEIYTFTKDRENVKLYAAVLLIACHYRYQFGLYDRTMAMEDYIQAKADNYPEYKDCFEVGFELETLRKEAYEFYSYPNDSVNLIEYFKQEVEVTFEDNKRYFAFMKINTLLWDIRLETNKDWMFPEDRDFSYWEMKVITEDLLSKLRNDLRIAYLDQNEFEIPNLVLPSMRCPTSKSGWKAVNWNRLKRLPWKSVSVRII